ncbi:hypothetical protein [Herbiconiux sp.]|uniref:hypothetical protein n=1 Tax=Herbiconiux sp. TaxID=1871186 RepID=UPI0025BD24B5|nr:hypothetical protein [Herbiconiux sp.]
MHPSPRHKPLWRWEVFLFAVVLLLAIVSGFLVRADWGIGGAIAVVALLVVAVAAAGFLIVPLLRPNGRDSENTRRSVEGVELVPLEGDVSDSGSRTVRVLQSERRQSAIEAARAKSAGEPRGVLTPDASRWLGRRLQVAVDLVADDGAVYRAGFLPPEIDGRVDALVQPLAARGAAAVVPVRVVGAVRPFRVEIDVPARAFLG